MRVSLRTLALIVALSACGARVDGPADDHAARDRATSGELTRVLGALPGAARVELTVQTPWRDPLASAPPAPAAPAAPIVIIAMAAMPDADRAALEHDARALVQAAVPGAAIAIAVRPIAAAPTTATVGPFEVARRSRVPLIATLAVALLAIAGLATWVVILDGRARRR